MEVQNLLLAALTALVGALVWVVKAMISRSDRLTEQRDQELCRTITALERSIDQNDESHRAEGEFRREILAWMRRSEEVQMQALEQMKKVVP